MKKRDWFVKLHMPSQLDTTTSILYIDFVPPIATDVPVTNAVRPMRRTADLTQAQLAAAVGVSRQTIVSIEKGDYGPSVYLALAIAHTLDTTVEALFGEGADQ